MIEKWATEETSFKTVTYENTHSTAKPKKVNPNAPAPREQNIVTNSENAKVEDYMMNGEYSSVSLTGVKQAKQTKR